MVLPCSRRSNPHQPRLQRDIFWSWGTEAFMCTATLWDANQWELQHCAHAGNHVLCTVISHEAR